MSVTWQVPGRIEVVGKHTDYAGGNVLVCAVEQAVTTTVSTASTGITVATDLYPGEVALGGDSTTLPRWANYAQTVVERLKANFGPLQPCRIEITSTLPPASGMSSSSATLCSIALALADLNGFSQTEVWRRHCHDDLHLAGYLATVENGRSWGELAGNAGVGTLGGSEDHTGMICGVEGALLPARFDPLSTQPHVPLDAEFSFVVAVSGVLAEKTGAAREAYNRASRSASEALERWNDATGRHDSSLAAAVSSLSGGAAPGPEYPPVQPLIDALGQNPALINRVEHFVAESCVHVPTAVDALRQDNLGLFTLVCDRSQAMAEHLLGNQIPETIRLARLATEQGAITASSFGAGFGGSVWALVRTADAQEFAERWLGAYRAEFPQHTDARAIITRPGAPAHRL